MGSMHVEIDSFTTKFKLLLSNGYKATLTFESVEGEVFATLKVMILSFAKMTEKLFTGNLEVLHT